MAESLCKSGVSEGNASRFRQMTMFFSGYRVSSAVFLSHAGPRNLREMCRVHDDATQALLIPVLVPILYQMGVARSIPKILDHALSLGKQFGVAAMMGIALYVMLNPQILRKVKPNMDRIVHELAQKEAEAFQDPHFFTPETREIFGEWCERNSTQELRLAVAELSSLRSFESIPAIIFFRPNGDPRATKMEVCKAIALYGRYNHACFEDGALNWIKCKSGLAKSAVHQFLHL